MVVVVQPPVPVSAVLDASIDALLGGSANWLHVPAGGAMAVKWQPCKGSYRLTVDLTAGHALATDAEVLTFLSDLRERLSRPPTAMGTERLTESGGER